MEDLTQKITKFTLNLHLNGEFQDHMKLKIQGILNFTHLITLICIIICLDVYPLV